MFDTLGLWIGAWWILIFVLLIPALTISLGIISVLLRQARWFIVGAVIFLLFQPLVLWAAVQLWQKLGG